jgi:predicted nucleic acid-binding protein
MAGSGSLPLRLVLDTNIVVAGLLWNGPPRPLLVAPPGVLQTIRS